MPVDSRDHDELFAIAAEFDGDEAKLLALMMRYNWSCPDMLVRSAFRGQFISAIIHNINDEAYDAIEENLIEEENGLLAVAEEYRAALEGGLKSIDNRLIVKERNTP